MKAFQELTGGKMLFTRIFFLRFLCGLLRVDLIKPVSMFVARSYVRMYVRPTVRPQKVFFWFERNLVCSKGRWVLHDDMSYDPIQGQGHGGPKVAKITDFRVYLLRRYACNQKTNVEYDTSTL